jgi:hypothetical protein
VVNVEFFVQKRLFGCPETAMKRSRTRQGFSYVKFASGFGATAVIAVGAALPLPAAVVLLPSYAVLPALCLGYLAIAFILAVAARFIGSDRDGEDPTLRDLSGACALLGFGAGIFTGPQDVMTAFAVVGR